MIGNLVRFNGYNKDSHQPRILWALVVNMRPGNTLGDIRLLYLRDSSYKLKIAWEDSSFWSPLK